MKYYLLIVGGRNIPSDLSWFQAIQGLGYSVFWNRINCWENLLRRDKITVKDKITHVKKESCIVTASDVMMWITTDAPINVISSLWRMTGFALKIPIVDFDKEFVCQEENV